MPKQPELSSGRLVCLAIVIALTIATLYYNQPILPLIGSTFDIADGLTSQIVTVGQVGYAIGLFLLVPLADRIDRHRLIVALLLVNTMGMAVCAAAPSFSWLLIGTLVAGIATVTPQIIIPTVAGVAPPERRGRAIGILLGGMAAGLVLGRRCSR
jgi:predicted MFS family arabinose efflux permease